MDLYFNDLQHQFSIQYGRDVYQQIGLKKVLEMLNIPFLGTPHNALNDAFNTAKVFKRNFDRLQLEHNVQMKKCMPPDWCIRLAMKPIIRLDNWPS